MAAENEHRDGTMALAAGFDAPTHDDWLALVETALKGRPLDTALTTRTADGIKLQALYTRADETAPLPAAVRATGTGWDIRQRHAHPDPKSANQAVLRDLERGATSIELRIDPTGAAGLRVRGTDDLDRTLAGVDLALAPVALRAGPAQIPAAEALLDLIAGRGGAGGAAHDLGLDPFGTLAAHGRLPLSLDEAVAAMTAVARRAGDALPAARPIVVDTSPYHEAGGNDVTDLAAMLATAADYLRALEAAGDDIDTALRRIGVELSVGVEVFQGIAKLRAARLLWARLAEACGASAAARRPACLSVAMAGRVVARRDAWVNMIRATASCFAAAVGGADVVTVLPYTGGLGLPDGFASRIARNTQIVLMEESNLHRVADPAGGSFAIEALTRTLAERAWSAFQEIEAAGGMAAALLSGRMRARVSAEWAERERAVARRRSAVIGVSEFPSLAEAAADVLVSPPPAPLGDDPFSAAWTAAQVELAPLDAHRLGEAYEALRDASDRFLAANGARPKAMLAQLGRLADYTARVTFTRNYLEAGGIEPAPAEVTADTAGTAVRESGAEVVVLCASDTIYEAEAVAVAEALRAAGAGLVLLAGRPGPEEARWRAAGIDGFIHAGDDTLAMLRRIAGHLGVTEVSSDDPAGEGE